MDLDPNFEIYNLCGTGLKQLHVLSTTEVIKSALDKGKLQTYP